MKRLKPITAIILLSALIISNFCACGARDTLVIEAQEAPKVDYDYILERMDLYRVGEGYTYWNETLSFDMYSSYYAIKILDKIGVEFQHPSVYSDLDYVFTRLSTMEWDLYLFCELFYDEISEDQDLKARVYDTLSAEYDNYSVPIALNDYCYLYILELTGMAQSGNWDLSEFDDRLEDYAEEARKEDSKIYSGGYLYLCYKLANILGLDSGEFKNEILSNFDLMEEEIRQKMFSNELLAVELKDDYIEICQEFGLESSLEKDAVEEYLMSLMTDYAGFALNSGAQMEVQASYDVLLAAEYFNIELQYDRDELVRYLLQHQLITNNWFVSVRVPEIWYDASLFAFWTQYLINEDMGQGSLESYFRLVSYLESIPDQEDLFHYQVLKNFTDSGMDLDKAKRRISAYIDELKNYYIHDHVRNIVVLLSLASGGIKLSDDELKNISEIVEAYKGQFEAEDDLLLAALYQSACGADKNSKKWLNELIAERVSDYPNPISVTELYAMTLALESSDQNLRKNAYFESLVNYSKYVLNETNHGKGIFCYDGAEEKFAAFDSIFYGVYSYRFFQEYY